LAVSIAIIKELDIPKEREVAKEFPFVIQPLNGGFQ